MRALSLHRVHSNSMSDCCGKACGNSHGIWEHIVQEQRPGHCRSPGGQGPCCKRQVDVRLQVRIWDGLYISGWHVLAQEGFTLLCRYIRVCGYGPEHSLQARVQIAFISYD